MTNNNNRKWIKDYELEITFPGTYGTTLIEAGSAEQAEEIFYENPFEYIDIAGLLPEVIETYPDDRQQPESP
ncbi:MAG: hypothetical protein F6K17_18670 [Okeania sp. SIO3C4]|nr:hypothetical protein [Okeania sp. SIO3C4]